MCPDFVLELVSQSEELETLRAKMREYLDNGCQLGWLIDPNRRQVEVYRPQRAVELVRSPKLLSGEDILPGFVLNLAAIFESDEPNPG